MYRERDKFRKFERHNENQKKNGNREEFLKSQQVALNKFLKQNAVEEGLSIVDQKTDIGLSIPSTSNDELSEFLPSNYPSAPDTQNLSICTRGII